MDVTWLVVAVGSWLAIEVIKIIMSQKMSVLLPEEKAWLKKLHEMHVKEDSSGRPLWYFPAHVVERQVKISQDCAEIKQLAIEALKAMDRRAEEMDTIREKQHIIRALTERVLDEVRHVQQNLPKRDH